nr:Chain B, N-terminal 6-mer peptide from Alba [Saccharolobus solfataricus]
SSGTPT